MDVPEARRARAQGARGRRRVVAVIGSGTAVDPACAGLGRLVAAMGFDLLTGGGRGTMEEVSRAFLETAARKGIVIGVIPGEVERMNALERRIGSAINFELRPGYPNPWVELAIYTHLPDSGPEGTLRSSRNHINVLSADAIVALPGGAGTESEVWLAKRYGAPIVAFGDHPTPPHAIPLARTLDEVSTFLAAALSTG